MQSNVWAKQMQKRLIINPFSYLLYIHEKTSVQSNIIYYHFIIFIIITMVKYLKVRTGRSSCYRLVSDVSLVFFLLLYIRLAANNRMEKVQEWV